MEEARKRGGALERYQEMEEKGIRFYSLYHPRYPSRLRNIPDSPYGIYVEGELPEEGIPSVAVIGSRQCSGYGNDPLPPLSIPCPLGHFSPAHFPFAHYFSCFDLSIFLLASPVLYSSASSI